MPRSAHRVVHWFVGLALILGLVFPLTSSSAFAQEADPPVETTVEETPVPEPTAEPTEPAQTETPALEPTATVPPVVKTPKSRRGMETVTPETTPAEIEPAEPTERVAETATAEPTETPTPKPAKTIEATSTVAPRLSGTTSAAISISKTKGNVGTSVTVVATGFPASATLTLRWDGATVTSGRADRTGKATFTLKVPPSYAGTHRISVTTTGKTKSKSFTVAPRMSISPTAGRGGTTVSVTLTGFGKSERITIAFAGKTVTTGTSDNTGGWKGSFRVPSGGTAGSSTILATGAGGSTVKRTFTVSSTSTPTPTATPTSTPVANPGGLEIRTTRSGGGSLAGACYKVFQSVSGQRGALLGEACDSADGANGVTNVPGLPSGSVIVVQSTVPDGYLPASIVNATVVAKEKRTVDVVNAPNSGLTVVKTDETGGPLSGACFALFTDIGGGKLGSQVASRCDNTDGADGVIPFGSVKDGHYVLVESVIPRGYARAANKRIIVSDGRSQLVTIANQPGGSVLVTLVNEAGDGIKGACFDAYVDLGGGAVGNFVDRGCNDAGNKITISGLPVGSYYLVESKTPIGFQAAEKAKFAIAAKKDTSLTVVNLPTTKLVIRKQAQDGTPLKSSCFEVYKNSGGSRGAKVGSEVCDNKDGRDDAYVTIAVSAGSYLLAETKAPKGYLRGKDIAFRIQTGLDTELDVINELGGTLLVHTHDTEYEYFVPTDACYTVWRSGERGTYTEKLGTACDAADGRRDGTTTIVGLPTGNWTLQQHKTPWGYFASPDIQVRAVAGETRDVDFYNDPWPLLIISKVDENSKPLGGACFTGYTDLGGGQRGAKWYSPDGDICDGDGDGMLYILVTPGNQILVETKAPLGYLPVQDTRFTMVKGQVTELTVVNRKVGMLKVTKTDMDGKLLTGACFEAYTNASGKRGTLMATGCDRETGKDSFNESLDGYIILNGLPPGQYWLVEKTPPKGYFAAPDQLVTITSGQNAVTVKNERWPELTITKVDDTGAAVKGACFQLFTIKNDARSTAFGGRACGTINNIIKLGAPPGEYLLAEVVTPKGLVTMPDQRIVYVRGKDMQSTIVNQPAGFVEVTNLREGDLPLVGSCWELYTIVNGKRGKQIDRVCSTNGVDTKGVTELEGPAGAFLLAQATVPDGYKLAADVKVTIIARQTTTVTVRNQPYPRWVVNSVDSGNEPLIGACFDLYVDEGTKLGKKVASKWCDKADGADDGTTSKRLEPGRYVAIEVFAPEGFAKTPEIKFTIEDGKDLVLKLQHQIAGVIEISVKDRSALVLKGACFEVWTRTSAGTKGVLVDRACDKNVDDPKSQLDGMVRLFALPPGTYILSESFPPAGYNRAADQTVTVAGGQTLKLVVINDKP